MEGAAQVVGILVVSFGFRKEGVHGSFQALPVSGDLRARGKVEWALEQEIHHPQGQGTQVRTLVERILQAAWEAGSGTLHPGIDDALHGRIVEGLLGKGAEVGGQGGDQPLGHGLVAVDGGMPSGQ